MVAETTLTVKALHFLACAAGGTSCGLTGWLIVDMIRYFG